MKPPVAVILAGGLSRRMGGGDKGLQPFAGGTLLGAVIDRIAPQVAALALNANGDPARFSQMRLDVIPDPISGHPGPLAGILAAMDWAAGRGEDAVITVPSDTPFLPPDLVPRLLLASEDAPDRPAIAACGGRHHPVIGRWPVALRNTLAAAIEHGDRKVMTWVSGQNPTTATFPVTTPDGFANVNTSADLAEFEAHLTRREVRHD